MYCPQCGIRPNDDLKFCNSCGANLQAVRQAMVSGTSGDEFSWSKTWVATMFLSGPERKLREEELERRRGITPEHKRLAEAKVGLITASAGLGGMILLFVLMRGIVAAAGPSAGAAAMLGSLWVVGIIPLLVGIAIILNARGATKRLVGGAGGDSPAGQASLDAGARPALSAPPSVTSYGPPEFGVTEGTTRELEDSPRKQESRWQH